MLQVLSLTVFALLVARLVRAPRGSWRYIVGAAVLALAASQFLPAGHPYRTDVAASARTLAWLGLAMVPLAVYGLWVRRLRRRTGVDRPAPAPGHPLGLVQIADDAALRRDTEAALADEAAAATGARPQTLSLGWRDAEGRLAGHLRLRIAGTVAEIEMLRVAPEARGRGVGRRLLAAAEAEAARRGARRVTAVVGGWQALPFFAAAGYRPLAQVDGGATARHWLEKTLQ